MNEAVRMNVIRDKEVAGGDHEKDREAGFELGCKTAEEAVERADQAGSVKCREKN